MLDYSQFSAVFPSEGPSPYDQRGVHEIDTLRKTFDGVLFIDRVLKALHFGDGKSYPPKGETGLRQLHRQICASKVSDHHKLSVLYYLLLDYDGLRGSRSQLAEDFSTSSGLPKKYQILMRGLWHMDRKEFKFALEHLAHPSLPSEFADEVVSILIRHAKGNDYSLPLAYYYTTQPVLKTSEALDLLFNALAKTSIPDALYFSRSYSDATRQRMFEKLISSVLNTATAGSARYKELVSSTLDSTEENWFEDFLINGEGKKFKLAATIVETRQIITGRHRGQISLRGLDENTSTAPRAMRSTRSGR